MNVISINDINCSARKNIENFIIKSENSYSDKISKIAQTINKNKNDCPILLISGPSGAGKTTTAKRMEEELLKLGIDSISISMDNYYLPKSSPNIPYNEDGTPDLESPYRLDIDLLHSHFSKILNYETINIPKFDFSSQERINGTEYKRKKNEIIILEGTHALNPVISENISEHAAKVYISVRTRLKLEDSRIIHPSTIRLMRRLCRDVLFRGKAIEDVFDMFSSVSYGEKKYITPYKKNADMEIDTYIPYETLIYKNMLKDKIKSKRDKLYQLENYKNIVRVFNELEEINDLSFVPGNSIIREFIGNSLYTY
jgi:uridine kinase